MLQWMPWQDAAGLAGATGATWSVTDRSPQKWARRLRPWARELTLTLVLYAMWQYAGAWSIGRLSSAATRGQDIWDLERTLHLPSEGSAQQLILPHHTLVHWLNEYYVQLHVPVLGACLLWLFIRHRDRYSVVRSVLVVVTGASLLIQMFPVAPPRLLPQAGIVDTGALIGPNDYAGGAPGIDQLSAMPSVHVAWALIVAGAIVWASGRRLRWLAVLYPVATILVVVVTGNHYWADGIVATALCVLAVLLVVRATSPRRHGEQSPDRSDGSGQSNREQDRLQIGESAAGGNSLASAYPERRRPVGSRGPRPPRPSQAAVNLAAPQAEEPHGQGGHVQLGVGGRLRRGRQ